MMNYFTSVWFLVFSAKFSEWCIQKLLLTNSLQNETHWSGQKGGCCHEILFRVSFRADPGLYCEAEGKSRLIG